jgi:lycopene cyclase domain-containing protein
MGNTTYLFLILLWAMPIILLQWLVGIDIVVRRWKVLVPGILLPTIYLTVVGSFALGTHIWIINPAQSLNIFIPLIHVPIEELLFLLLTNTMIAQGLILLFAPETRFRLRALANLARRIHFRKESEDHIDQV